MEFSICNWCGRVLPNAGRGIHYCPGCAQKEAEALRKIRTAAESNPGMSAIELSRTAKLPISQIEHFLKAGKIGLR